MNQKGKKPKSKGKSETTRVSGKRYDVKYREKIVRMHLDDKIPIELLHAETKVSRATLREWVRRFSESGIEGLSPISPPGRGPQLPEVVSEKIIEIKKENPTFGVRRIGDVLGRWFGLPGSREKVRQVLNEEDLATPPKTKRQHNPSKPRFFERATPNQMWQTDIMSFRLAGKQVYLIGFMDDYSRYIVGLGLYASQTTEHVLEVYRKACTEYGVPKEMLTDNGRQYTNWRGKTKFEGELQKDKVKHIKSQPHHPQTLGKIERFWKTILEEYLARAQFDSFENARERIGMWVKHYNHRRPHQGIEGVCPADRFYEVASEVRKVIERQIEANILELALRGKPKEPFYLVGRMDGQSVVLQAEKGKLKLSVGGQNKDEMQEKEFTIGDENGRNGQTQKATQTQAVQCLTEGSSGAHSVDGATETFGNLSRNGSELDYIRSMAEACDGRNAASLGVQCELGERCCVESSPASLIGTQKTTEENREVTSTFEDERRQCGEINDVSRIRGNERESPQENGCNPTSGVRTNDSDRGGEYLGDIETSVLRMGESSLDIHGGSSGGQAERSTSNSSGQREGTAIEGIRGNESGSRSSDLGLGHQEHSGDPSPRNGYGAHIWTGR